MTMTQLKLYLLLYPSTSALSHLVWENLGHNQQLEVGYNYPAPPSRGSYYKDYKPSISPSKPPGIRGRVGSTLNPKAKVLKA